MAKLERIIHINNEDFTELVSEGEITIGNVTYIYDDSGSTEYIIDDPSAPEYADTAGYATAAGTANISTSAESDINGVQFIENYLKKAEEISYSALVSKVQNDSLIPNQWYRITDYVTTTTQTNTQSAGHAFDIVVMAVATNKLDPKAKAVLRNGDTYFSASGNKCNLTKWEIWYDIANDTSRYSWADTTNGKGVIYRMIDEWGNDCPYDFKNIQFKRKLTDGSLDTTSGTNTWVYTFNMWNIDDEEIEDASLIVGRDAIDDGTNLCYGNVIKPYYPDARGTDTISELNDNVFLNTYSIIDLEYITCHNNTFGNNCFSNTFGNNCFSNTFGDYFSSNTFETNCYNNTFGNNCYINTLSYGCYSNTFGTNCYRNSFGQDCHGNTFGNYCSRNTFGNGCYYNTFDNGCQSNTFGNYCHTNAFGNYCDSNTFGNSCTNNTFGNGCNHNTLWHYSESNSFGESCYSNTLGSNSSSSNKCVKNSFGDGCYSNTLSYGCSNNSFGNVCYSNSFGEGCNGNIFGNVCNSNTFGNNCFGNTFGNSCKGNSFRLRNIYNTLGDNCSYIKFIPGSGNNGSYARYIVVDNGCCYINIYKSDTTILNNYLQNIYIAQGVQGTSSSYVDISTIERNLSYRTTVAKLSDGTIRIYKEDEDDMLPSITGNANKVLSVNGSATGVEWTTPTSSLVGLSDTTITSASNGQTLIYNSTTEKWENQDIPSDAFICTFTMTADSQTGSDVYSCDKTIAEIIAAANANKRVFAYISLTDEGAYGAEYIPLNSFMHVDEYFADFVTFGGIIHNVGGWADISVVGINIEQQDRWETQQQFNSSSFSKSLGDLTDVSVYNPQAGQVLTYNGGGWGAATPVSSLASLTDTIIANPSIGQILMWGGSYWNNVTADLEKMQNVTYSELVALKNNNSLVPGKFYKITDYETTTTQTNTRVLLNLSFNIIVLATTFNMLDCHAICVFGSNQTNKIRILYDIDNNTNKYAWADTTNGKGVIYRMIDEYGNDCPYDFFNIQFKVNVFDIGDVWLYTFSYRYRSNEQWYVASQAGASTTRNNIIKPYYIQESGYIKQYLNGNVFWGNDSYPYLSGNTIGNNCHDNSFMGNFNNNIIKDNCHDIITTGKFSENTIGNSCSYITFSDSTGAYGDYIKNVTVGDNCEYLRLYGTSDNTYLQNININNGIQGTSSNILEITSIPRNLSYMTTVAKLSDGTIRIYREDEDDINVKPDWNATAGTAAEILNKPTVPTISVTTWANS